jgi:hypothetical protein
MVSKKAVRVSISVVPAIHHCLAICLLALSQDGVLGGRPPQVELLLADRPVTLRISRKGLPWINLRDGRLLQVSYRSYSGRLSLLAQEEGDPLSLCAADLDEDGVPDLVSGYGLQQGGLIAVQRGSIDSIFPDTPEARERNASGRFTDSPFFSQSVVFTVPERPDFIGSGDFDGDG